MRHLPYRRLSVWIRDTNLFYFYVRVHATNGSDYYIRYEPTTGSPSAYGSYAIVPVGAQYKDGTWRELNRDLSADLQTVFGVGVESVKWFCIRGDYDLDDLALLDGQVATRYYFFGGQRVAMRKADVVYYLLSDHLGTTSLVLNSDGTVHSQARHYPYGEVGWEEGPGQCGPGGCQWEGIPTDYRFTGQRVEASLGGIYQMGARWYPSLHSGQATPRWPAGCPPIRWCRSRQTHNPSIVTPGFWGILSSTPTLRGTHSDPLLLGK